MITQELELPIQPFEAQPVIEVLPAAGEIQPAPPSDLGHKIVDALPAGSDSSSVNSPTLLSADETDVKIIGAVKKEESHDAVEWKTAAEIHPVSPANAVLSSTPEPDYSEDDPGNSIIESASVDGSLGNDDKHVSFAPDTPEPKPTPRKKKKAKGKRDKKKMIAYPIDNLPDDIVAIIDEGVTIPAPPPAFDQDLVLPSDHDAIVVQEAIGSDTGRSELTAEDADADATMNEKTLAAPIEALEGPVEGAIVVPATTVAPEPALVKQKTKPNKSGKSKTSKIFGSFSILKESRKSKSTKSGKSKSEVIAADQGMPPPPPPIGLGIDFAIEQVIGSSLSVAETVGVTSEESAVPPPTVHADALAESLHAEATHLEDPPNEPMVDAGDVEIVEEGGTWEIETPAHEAADDEGAGLNNLDELTDNRSEIAGYNDPSLIVDGPGESEVEPLEAPRAHHTTEPAHVEPMPSPQDEQPIEVVSDEDEITYEGEIEEELPEYDIVEVEYAAPGNAGTEIEAQIPYDDAMHGLLEPTVGDGPLEVAKLEWEGIELPSPVDSGAVIHEIHVIDVASMRRAAIAEAVTVAEIHQHDDKQEVMDTVSPEDSPTGFCQPELPLELDANAGFMDESEFVDPVADTIEDHTGFGEPEQADEIESGKAHESESKRSHEPQQEEGDGLQYTAAAATLPDEDSGDATTHDREMFGLPHSSSSDEKYSGEVNTGTPELIADDSHLLERAEEVKSEFWDTAAVADRGIDLGVDQPADDPVDHVVHPPASEIADQAVLEILDETTASIEEPTSNEDVAPLSSEENNDPTDESSQLMEEPLMDTPAAGEDLLDEQTDEPQEQTELVEDDKNLAGEEFQAVEDHSATPVVMEGATVFEEVASAVLPGSAIPAMPLLTGEEATVDEPVAKEAAAEKDLAHADAAVRNPHGDISDDAPPSPTFSRSSGKQRSEHWTRTKPPKNTSSQPSKPAAKTISHRPGSESSRKDPYARELVHRSRRDSPPSKEDEARLRRREARKAEEARRSADEAARRVAEEERKMAAEEEQMRLRHEAKRAARRAAAAEEAARVTREANEAEPPRRRRERRPPDRLQPRDGNRPLAKALAAGKSVTRAGLFVRTGAEPEGRSQRRTRGDSIAEVERTSVETGVGPDKRPREAERPRSDDGSKRSHRGGESRTAKGSAPEGRERQDVPSRSEVERPRRSRRPSERHEKRPAVEQKRPSLLKSLVGAFR